MPTPLPIDGYSNPAHSYADVESRRTDIEGLVSSKSRSIMSRFIRVPKELDCRGFVQLRNMYLAGVEHAGLF
jgi:hypothetical protein